jgi:pimeloyl-ACP methyl ester carboxylesterase
VIELDPFNQDPIVDSEYPATQATFPINSNNFHLNAIIEIAQGKGPHPTIILLHGFPGNEKNFDLAHIFRRAGFNVLIFYYRGSWGSGGIYSFQNCIDDVDAVLEHLRDSSTAKTYRIDPTNLILIGHSWGGFVALYAGTHDDQITRIASISGFNIRAFGKWIQSQEVVDNEMYDLLSDVGPLRGTSGKQLLEEIMNRYHFWDLLDLSPKLTK